MNVRGWLVIGTLVWACATAAFAQRDLKDIPAPDPEIERAALVVADGFEINLYAADPLLAKPIQMNFDAAGRLWVASSETYPQIEPGKVASDKIVILEDADGDGRAEKTSVFADGLLIPTGIEPGDGGAYVGASTELLHLADTNGDGRADRRRVVLSGFGTEDTHHIVHTLRWGHDGNLYFNQSIYIHSHIETPYGVRRLGGGGIWQFRPESMRLEVFARGWWNTWGHHFDRWGQSFVTDGAGGKGINYAFPGSVFEATPGASRIITGLNPGSPKYCGLEVLSGRHLPEAWQGNLITNDFRGHRVCRFVVADEGSGYVSRELPELIKTSHVAFRPIDVKMGPDGAIYIADWCNPIIQHGEVDFRDPRRDHTHGRIWRVTAKGRALAPRPKLVTASNQELCAALASPEGYTRHHARRVLKERGNEVLGDLNAWVAGLPADGANDGERLEALWTYQSLAHIESKLLGRVLASTDPKIRAAAVRVLGAWSEAIPEAPQKLAKLAVDEHPRICLEAVAALGQLGTKEAFMAALPALDRPLDDNLDFALWQMARVTSASWLPVIETSLAEEKTPAIAPAHLLFALKAVSSPDVVTAAVRVLQHPAFNAKQRDEALELIARHGSAAELKLVFDHALNDQELEAAERAKLLDTLLSATVERRVKPAGDLTGLAAWLASPDVRLNAAAARAAGKWKLEPLHGPVTAFARNRDTPTSARYPAVEALADFNTPHDRELLVRMAADPAEAIEARAAFVEALARVAPGQAAGPALELLKQGKAELDAIALVEPFVRSPNGARALREAAEKTALPADVAKLAVRAVRLLAKPDDALIAALRKAAGLGSGPKELSADELAALAKQVAEHGDAARGEAIYRRQELACVKCHAVGGAGGQVGPDILSIGATAQLDYLIESILVPSKKIKENYNAIVVQTDDGRSFAGIKVREADGTLTLRTADDQLINIPVKNIEAQGEGQSLMPVGLADDLTRDELVDLVRFLSELGRTTAFTVSRAPLARRWDVLQMNQEPFVRLGRTGIGTIASDPTNLVWLPTFSTVAGELPVDTLPTMAAAQRQRQASVTAPPLAFVRATISARGTGKVKLRFNSTAGLRGWLGPTPLSIEPETAIELSPGTRTLTLAIDGNEREEPLRVELIDANGSPVRAEWVTSR